eukprot:TRINITY_DN19398_c0_g1_i1.p1 TRINITY_DN19398_c0_g1~~TRINITY_DN19398_c0_g1_i1.p1  ORF type:complete len:341 (-),score=53.99 TRINITY_DN19398_c0_g1_i1:103-1086(-)
MKGALYIVCIVLLISIVNAHGHHGHGKPAPHAGHPVNERSSARDACFYTTPQHQHYDLHLINSLFPGDLVLQDPKSGNTLYFNPCGAVHSSRNCGENSTICLVSSSGKAISYASTHSFVSTLLPAASPTSSPVLEVMFGQGELCSTGVARKAVVTYTCSHLQDLSHSFSNYKHYYPLKSAEVSDCFVSINIETPLACPVKEFCSSIHNSKDCDQQRPCGWLFGKCQQVSVIFGVEIGLTVFILMGALGCLFFCCCCFCMFLFVKKSKKSSKKAVLPKKARKVSQKKRKSENAGSFEMDSFESPYHLVPGGFVAVEEYSHVQGLPLSQ